MKTRIFVGFIVMMFVFVAPLSANGKGDIQKYFNDTANKVKATENAAEKREILNDSFQNLSKALDKVENMGLVSSENRDVFDQFKNNLQEKQDELAGNNGYERIPDSQLNNFSNYVVQDMEQALSISLVALLLIIILVILLI